LEQKLLRFSLRLNYLLIPEIRDIYDEVSKGSGA